MKRYRVEYEIIHTREFWVKDEKQIHDILNEYNQCKIVKITELPTNNDIFENAGN